MPPPRGLFTDDRALSIRRDHCGCMKMMSAPDGYQNRGIALRALSHGTGGYQRTFRTRCDYGGGIPLNPRDSELEYGGIAEKMERLDGAFKEKDCPHCTSELKFA